jgi:general secretion pathway protein J
VLIAAAIFGSMVTLAAMALNQGLKQYQGLLEKGLNFWDYARYVWIQRSFNSAADYYIYTKLDGWAPYFIGNQELVSYVSLSPLAGERPVVVWIRNEQEGDRGKRSLVYYELPVETKTFEAIERDAIFADYKKGNSVKLLEGLDALEVSYYGYDLGQHRYLWSRDFDARKKKLLPTLVKVGYGNGESKNFLIFGVNVNSTIKMNYNETLPGL